MHKLQLQLVVVMRSVVLGSYRLESYGRRKGTHNMFLVAIVLLSSVLSIRAISKGKSMIDERIDVWCFFYF